MEMYGEDGSVEIGSTVLMDFKENETLIEMGVSKFLRRLYPTCDARKLVVWRINKSVSAIWSMTGSMAYPANENAYRVMMEQAHATNAQAPPPIPCGAVMLINNVERDIVEEQAYKVIKHAVGDLLTGRSGLDIAMIDMGVIQ